MRSLNPVHHKINLAAELLSASQCALFPSKRSIKNTPYQEQKHKKNKTNRVVYKDQEERLKRQEEEHQH